MNGLALRPATENDQRTIFEWRNQPFIYERGSLQRPVSWDEHVAWFDASLARPGERLLLIVEIEGRPVGLVRFDRTRDTEATISVYLTQEHAGRGLGSQAISRGCEALRGRWDVRHVLACVREDNLAATKAFLRAGFIEAAPAACPPQHRAFRFAF